MVIYGRIDPREPASSQNIKKKSVGLLFTERTGHAMQKKLKVVIGDNTMEMGITCQDILKRSGAEVVLTPKDGAKILEAMKTNLPDVVVMEPFMAQMDAISVMKAASQSGLHPRFIVISGHESRFIEDEVMHSGASYYMLKPFDMEALCERIRAVGNSAPLDINSVGANSDDIESIITEIILHIGIPAHIKGYHYIREAIILSVQNTGMMSSVTKLLYPTIAKKFGTTSSRVERAIRHAIEIAWDRGDVDTLNNYFGYTVNTGRGKPTNSEFIAMISDKLRLKLKNHHLLANVR